MIAAGMFYLLLDRTRNWLDSVGLYRFVRVLDQLEFRVLAAAIVAFVLVIVLGKPTIRTLRRMKIGDAGMSDAEALRAHATSKANTPTMGGVLIAGAIAISVVLLADLGVFWIKLGLLVVLWSAVLGGFDDYLKLTTAQRGGGRQGLKAWEKLVFQLGLGLLVGYFVFKQGAPAGEAGQMVRVLNLPGQKTYVGAGEPAPGLIFLPAFVFVGVTMLLVAGMSNAVNLTDGMDGLAAGISTAVVLGIVLLALIAGTEATAKRLLVPYVPGAGEVAVLAGAVAGACLGFLWWNCAPAQVFMGDTGSLCLGAVIAYMMIVVKQEVVVLLMCGVFLAEIASVVMQVGYYKASGGKRIFKCAPIHHHFHLGGWTEQQIVVRAWLVTVLLVVIGLTTLKLR